MAGLNETPRANRIHIAFFGLRNAGKSTLVNAFTGQDIAIVSDVAGTTTDPVSKAMEILPLGPCLVTDTAGLDDVGDLGAMRVRKTLDVLATTDIAVWVTVASAGSGDDVPADFRAACAARAVTLLVYRRGDSVEELKRKIAAVRLVDDTPGLLDGIVSAGDRVICVCPIDESAPKGRLILPQVQVIRDCLDRHLACTVCQPAELADCLASAADAARTVVITDSQAFAAVHQTLQAFQTSKRPNAQTHPPHLLLDSLRAAEGRSGRLSCGACDAGGAEGRRPGAGRRGLHAPSAVQRHRDDEDSQGAGEADGPKARLRLFERRRLSA